MNQQYEVGQALRDIRVQQRLTQQALSVRTGVNQGTIARIERGTCRSPGIQIIARLCIGLRVSMDAIMGIHAGRANDDLAAAITALPPEYREVIRQVVAYAADKGRDTWALAPTGSERQGWFY